MRSISELRQDIVSGDWVVIATGRGRRPHDFARKDRDHWWLKQKKGCPFDELIDSAFYVSLKDGEIHKLSKKNRSVLEREWFLQIIPNKYPAFGKGVCAIDRKVGPYHWEDGVGFHDVVVLRDHEKTLANLSLNGAETFIRAYRDRYRQLKDEDCVQYISIFHNYGPEAGASVAHYHSQIIALPVVPPDVGRSIAGSAKFFHKNKKCVHCVMIDFEKKEKRRLVYENEKFIAFAPYASRTAFEVRVFPKAHSPTFESLHNSEIVFFADALKNVFSRFGQSVL